MKSIITLCAACAAVAASAAVPSGTPSLRSLIPAFGMTDWRPATMTIQQFDHNATGDWADYSTVNVDYDPRGRVTRTEILLPAVTGAASTVTTYSYPSDGATQPDTVTVSIFNTVEQTAILYDEVVDHFPTRIAMRSKTGAGAWTSWAVLREIAVERDSRGRVTQVTPRVLSAGDCDVIETADECEALAITYGADSNPSTIVSRTAEYDDATGVVEFDDAVTLSNIRWKECNCQILTLADLYCDGNRPLAAGVRADGVTGTMTFDYGTDGGYTARFAGTEDGARYENSIVYEPLDGNGSFRRMERERNFTEGYEDMESLLERYDRFGICTELLRESTSTDPDDDNPHEIDTHLRTAVTYSAADGFPQMTVTEVIIDGTTRFAPVRRVLYDGFNPAGIAGIEADSPAASTGIYDLAGRRLRAASRPGIYIIDGRKVLVR